ncbi:MAG: type II toxin-antitoxin system HicB family antitoxin [Candidatus Acidiferrales bacterium]
MMTVKDYLEQPYARIVIPVEADGFHAEILEFPGCFAQGKTVEDAYANLEKAAEAWIDACLSQGQEIPEPSSNLTFSGRVALRLPRSIHRQAVKMAERDQTSLNTYLVSAVSAKVGAEDICNMLAQRLEQRLVQAAYYAYNYVVEQTAGTKIIRPLLVEKSASTVGTQSNLANIGR